MSLRTLRPTNVLLMRASACLIDPDQTAVAPGIQHPLGTLLATLTHTDPSPDGARDTALAILDHEHNRITAEPTPDPIAAAKAEALRAAAAQITGADTIPLGRRQTKEWLLGLADHAEGKR